MQAALQQVKYYCPGINDELTFDEISEMLRNRPLDKVHGKDNKLRSINLATLKRISTIVLGDSALDSLGNSAFVSRDTMVISLASLTLEAARALLEVLLEETRVLERVVLCIGTDEFESIPEEEKEKID
jgi:hypothetical protein